MVIMPIVYKSMIPQESASVISPISRRLSVSGDFLGREVPSNNSLQYLATCLHSQAEGYKVNIVCDRLMLASISSFGSKTSIKSNSISKLRPQDHSTCQHSKQGQPLHPLYPNPPSYAHR